MGCSSVYCQISRIAINEGDDCVLIPMSKPKSQLSYRVYQIEGRWLPLTLPIFGQYDDYQGMESVGKNLNTELIERVTGIDIDTFAKEIYDNEWHLKELREYGEIKPCWILRDVWNLMNHIGSDSFLDLGLSDVMGHDDVLLKLGFRRVEDISGLTLPSHNPQRFNKAYELDGKIIWSDGRWVDEKPFTRIKFAEMFPSVNKDVLFSSPVKLMSKSDLASTLPLIQVSELMNWYDKMGERLSTKMDEFRMEVPRTPMSDAYWCEIKADNTFMIDLFYELECVFRNMRNMSCIFEPMVDYVTPQCGEHKEHLRFAREFVRILEDKIKDYEL